MYVHGTFKLVTKASITPISHYRIASVSPTVVYCVRVSVCHTPCTVSVTGYQWQSGGDTPVLSTHCSVFPEKREC